MPLHFMQVIRLPDWLVCTIDSLRRKFLWRGDKECTGGHCLVNWTKCCLLKQNGGLGILNLRIQNEALLAKWVWTLLKQPDSTLAVTISNLYGTLDIEQLMENPLISSQLLEALRTFSFLRHGITYLPGDTTPRWKWTVDKQYSVASAYRIMSNTGVIADFHKDLWKIKGPPRVRIFIWLLLLDKLLTQRNLLVRGWPSISCCVLCEQQIEKSTDHLFVSCQFTNTIWEIIALQFNLPIQRHHTTPLAFW